MSDPLWGSSCSRSCNVKQLAGMVAKMSKTSPSASVCDSSFGVWSRRPFRLLLDSCSDAHIISEKSAFLFLVAPDVKEIEVGKQGESVGFAGMGPVPSRSLRNGL